ncbi:MAG TPA: alginate lyase family protein [Gemmatimonadaceae bacterium]
MTTSRPAQSRLGQLRGRTPDELRVRALQSLSARMERLGISSQSRECTDAELFRRLDPVRVQLPQASADALLAHFRARRCPQFFAGFADPARTVEVLRQTWPDAEQTLVASARHIQRGALDQFEWNAEEGAGSPDWHLDPRSATRAPLRHWSQIPFLDSQSAGDCRITWELNRHQYFSTLGRAYWCTGDETFARTFVHHLSNWMTANPPKIGINWVSSLEVAFRSISWLWALQFFRQSPELTAPVFLRMLKFLYLHARHLETYLSTYFSPNTHLSGEALGLLYLGTLLPEFQRARRWQETGWRILHEELVRQVRPDGVYFEQASQYHRYTTDFHTHACILAEANDLSISDSMRGSLQRLLDHLMWLTRPDGTTPFIGDDDGGQLVRLDDRAPNDFRGTLATGAAFFRRADYAYVAREPSQETLWLLGPAGVERFQALKKAPPEEASRGFTSAGCFVMRDGWNPNANYALIDCGPHGALTCAHAHADALAFELIGLGCPFLTDSGTYTYTGSLAERNYFRSSAAHNTVTVDGESSSVPGSAFRWSHVANARLASWVVRPRIDYFEGAHDGYERLADPATHRRSVFFLKNEYWVLRDVIESKGFHRVAVHFHCPPSVRAQLEGDHQITLTSADAGGREVALRIAGFASHAAFTRDQEWVSPSYAKRVRAVACVLNTEGIGPQEIVTVLVPFSGESFVPRVREVAASAGRAFVVVSGDRHDTLLIGARGGSETKGVVADAEWIWVRRSGSGAVLEFVVLAGRALSVDGTTVFRANDAVGYVAGRSIDGGWVLDSDDGDKPTVAPRPSEIVLNDTSMESSDPCAVSAE